MQKMRSGMRWVFARLSLILTSNIQDTDRYLALGANPEIVYHTGNLKFDTVKTQQLTDQRRSELMTGMGLQANDRIILGASTWPGEEELLIQVFEHLRQGQGGLGELKQKCYQNLSKRTQTEIQAPLSSGSEKIHGNLKLILVPRHAERGNEIEELLRQKQFHYQRRSRSKEVLANTEIILADTTGELPELVQLADAVFVGKSIRPNRGGQNPIEPAAAAKPVLMGPEMGNFRDISKSLVSSGGGVWVMGAEQLKEVLSGLMCDAPVREKMGQAAKTWYEENCGATLRTLECLELMPADASGRVEKNR